MILAGIYQIVGESHTRMRVALAVITILTAPLLCLLCLLLFDHRSIALLAGLSWSVLPTNQRLAGLLLGESIAALLLTSGLVLTVLADRTRSLVVAALAGLALGYAALTRGYLLFAILGPVVWLLVRKLRREAAVLVVVVAMVLGTWVIGNVVRMGTVALSTETEVLWQGNNAWARGSWPGDWASQEAYLRGKYSGFLELDEVGRARVYLREAVAEYLSSPTRILWLLPRKAIIFFSPSSYLGFDWLYLVLLPFCLVGAVYLAVQPENRLTLWLLGSPVVGVLIVCLLTFGDPRFRHPVDPFLVALACVGLVQLRKLTSLSRNGRGPRRWALSLLR
jgi:hypothetical protein